MNGLLGAIKRRITARRERRLVTAGGQSGWILEAERWRVATPDELVGLFEVEVCRGCGCTELRACPGGCWWVARGLCSNCWRSYGGTD